MDAPLNAKAIAENDVEDVFKWPIITAEDESAVLEVLRRGGMSGLEVTEQFEKEFASWNGTNFALGFNNGTSALHSAMYGCGVGVGDEVISSSLTYWATVAPCLSLGATPVFADVDVSSLCIDPEDIEKRISKNTKAIIVVHYLGHPADMDRIMSIAGRHGVKVIEDVSHAQGGLYRGQKLGSIGDVGAISLMAGKPLVAGEAGMLVTDSREIYERAIAFGHYRRFNSGNVQNEVLAQFAGLPLGGYKYRMHQLSAALGRVQLKHYDARSQEIRNAMNRFWDLLVGVPGIRAHRTDKASESTMGGWYKPHGFYDPSELGGLSVTRFAEAVRSNGSSCKPGANLPLHLHPLFNTCDVYGHGRPTRIANVERDVRQMRGSLPVTEAIGTRLFEVPWFKRDDRQVIEEHAKAYRRVAENYADYLGDDGGNPKQLGDWYFFDG